MKPKHTPLQGTLLTFFLSCLCILAITVVQENRFQGATTGVSLVVLGSGASVSSSSSDSSSSVSSSSSSVSSSSAASSAASSQSSSEEQQGPAGQYRHRETRMQEIILRVMRRRLQSAPPTPPQRPPRVPSSPAPDPLLEWMRLIREWPAFDSLEMQLPRIDVQQEELHPSATGALPAWQQAEDLNPEDYGWVSSDEKPGWLWDMVGERLHLPAKAAAFEWVLWVILIILFVLGAHLGIRCNDALTDWILKHSKKAEKVPLARDKQK